MNAGLAHEGSKVASALLELLFDRAGGCGEYDGESDFAVGINIDVLYHAERYEVAAKVGVFDDAECAQHFFSGGHGVLPFGL